jgi:hypothetical protein
VLLVKFIYPLLGGPKKNREFDNFLYGYETGTAPGGIYSKV